ADVALSHAALAAGDGKESGARRRRGLAVGKSDARRIRLRRRAPGLLHEIAQSRGLIHPHLLHLPGRRCLPYTNRDTMASAMATGWGASMSSGTDCPVVMK